MILIIVVFLGADNSVKLGDFGLSKLMQSHDFASTYVGTPFYMSPEICAAERYTLQSDIWSLGCIMYELCARTPPFNAKTHFHLVQKIKEGRVEPLPSLYSQELQAVIKSCLKTNPTNRPDTACLLNLPMVRLMRKEREVVELGKTLKLKEEHTTMKTLEAEAKCASIEVEKEKMRVSIESTVRREWEVKARLEIDRQLQIERENLQKTFEMEIQSQVKKEVQQRLESLSLSKQQTPAPPTDIQFSSISTSAETDFPSSTDLSSLSLESPPLEKPDSLRPKKSTRTPFSRARTQFDSPMDVQMSESSPMSIACLSLSPRRTAAAAAASNIPNRKNIFAIAAAQKANPDSQKSKLNPQMLPSPTSSLDPTVEEDDDCLPELPSPTRVPSSHQDPFKLPTARPGLFRQKTAPTRRLNPHLPAQFPPPVKHPRIPSPTNTTSSGSPVRKAPPKPSSAGTETDIFKAVLHRNLLGNGTGRTLVELAQARAGGAPSFPSGGEKGFEAPGSREREAPVWDPERDEMPSPFLVRGGRGLRRL